MLTYETACVIIAFSMSCLILILLFIMRQRMVGTTLTGPCSWAIAAVLAISSVEVFVRWLVVDLLAGDALRHAAAVMTLCPALSLLGARRPHDMAWHFVVVGFWFVCVLPAAEAYWIKGGPSLEIQPVWSVLVGGGILLGLVNRLPTRFWLSAVLFAAGQALLFGGRLMFGEAVHYPRFVGANVCFFLAGFTGLCVWWYRSERIPGSQRLWYDFRNAYGWLWSARLADRVKDMSVRKQWDVSVHWYGLRSGSEELGENGASEVEDGVILAMRGILRRFVSEDWISQRL